MAPSEIPPLTIWVIDRTEILLTGVGIFNLPFSERVALAGMIVTGVMSDILTFVGAVDAADGHRWSMSAATYPRVS